MAVGKANPLRQMMINMMYLVLTALLALNVSAEILKAFQTVNDGMTKSINLIDTKVDQTNSQFAKLMSQSATAESAREFDMRAKNVNKICNDLYNYVEDLRTRVIYESGGQEPEEDTPDESDSVMLGMKNLEVAPRLFINLGLGEKLKDEIEKAREDLIKEVKSVKEIDYASFVPNITLKVDEPKKKDKTWAEESFHMVPAIAAVTLLTKIQQDIRTTQANIIDKLLLSIGAKDFKFDKLIPVVNVVTGKSAVAVGEQYKAEILLAAYDSKQAPKIFLGDKELEVIDGKATFEGATSQQMSFDQEGKIVVAKKGTDVVEEYPFRLAYDVFNAPAIISATKMNVVYIDLDNPMEISVPGYRPQDISATCSGGSISQTKPGEYIVKVQDTRGKVREANIRVSVKQPDGSSKFVGEKKFRIKRVPSPTPFFGSKNSGEIGRGEIRVVNFITVRLQDFPYDLKYSVQKYKMVYKPARGQGQMLEANNARLTPGMKGLLGNPNKGDMIIITNIYAKSNVPGARSKQISGNIVLTVK
jgi:gliding motility-associated protein GldM